MENQINNRLRKLIKKEELTQKKFCEIIDISEASLKSIFYNNHNPNTEILSKIANSFPQYSINWLLTGNGEMTMTEYNAGRDNNVITGDNNKNYTISGSNQLGMVGEVSGNYVNVGADQKTKKIIEGDKITIEMEQSIESLQQTVLRQEARIKDLETLITSKDRAYEDMKNSRDYLQSVIDRLMSK